MKIGKKRKVGICKRCGANLYEEYTSWPVYHNDYAEGWREIDHEVEDCIIFLAKLIKKLESPLYGSC